MKKTVILGASPNPWRVSYSAVGRLIEKGHEPIAIGVREGNIDGIPIQKGQPDLQDVDTVTLYLNAARQKQYYDYILQLQPKRIIFNPGAENPELVQLANRNGIETELACTLVMLAVGEY